MTIQFFRSSRIPIMIYSINMYFASWFRWKQSAAIATPSGTVHSCCLTLIVTPSFGQIFNQANIDRHL